MTDLRSTPPAAQPLLFIAGALRSGSTLLALMLDRHSRIGNPGEFDYLFDALGVDGGLAAAQALTNGRFDEFLAADRMYQGYALRMREAGTPVERIRDYVRRLASDDRLLAINLHRNFLSAHEIFPQARFVHLLRDPRDCAKSSIGMGWAGNVYHGLDAWLHAEHSWERLRPRLREDQFLELRFEDMVAEPQAAMTRLCSFFGFDYEPAMMDLSGTTYDTPSPRFANQWRRTMSERDIALVEARAGQLLVERGYERASARLTDIGRLDLLALKTQNAWARHLVRIERYGPSLWLQDVVTRRLGMREAQRAVRLRLNELEMRYLK